MKKILQKFSSDDIPRDVDGAYRALVTHITDDPRLREALFQAPRTRFIPLGNVREAGVDAPVAIPGGQTNSQPTTVAIMLRELQVRPGDTILDVGFGSGWTTALLAVLVGKGGNIYGVELNAHTYAFGKANLARFHKETGVSNFEVRQGDGSLGWPEHAPFDRILVSAGARGVPAALKSQLKEGGRMVIPVDEWDGSQSLVIIQKQNNGSFLERRIPGFRFVPLV